MNTNTNTHKYGLKLDGTPKLMPGRKAFRTKTVHIVNGKAVVMRGQPSLDFLKTRLQAVIPINQEYNPAVHGPGVRSAADDARVAEIESLRASRLPLRNTPPAGPAVGGQVSESASLNETQEAETVTV